jgi:predicted phosphohydrolase
MTHTCTREAAIRKITVQGQPSQIVQDPISKITRPKWAVGVARAIEYLLCNTQSPEFKPQFHPKKKKKELRA